MRKHEVAGGNLETQQTENLTVKRRTVLVLLRMLKKRTQ